MAQPATPLVPFVSGFVAAPAVWLLHLLAVYAVTGVVCARDASRRSVLNLDVVSFAVLLVTAVACVAIALSLARARRTGAAAGRSDAERFADALAIGLGLLSLVAVAWTASTALLVPACAGPGVEAAGPAPGAAGAALAPALATRAPRRRSARSRHAAAVLALLLACRPDVPDVQVLGGDAARGRALVASYHCGVCHAIPGVRHARGVVGPSLEGFARRAFIAGRLPNTPSHLVQWVRDPPSLDPRTAMPAVGLDEQEARDVAAYLYQLR